MSGAIAIVAAVALDGTIGHEGAMPWRLASDLARFKALTMGAPVVMGRKTFESLPGPLAGRMPVVVTRSPDAFGAASRGTACAPSVAEALCQARALAAEAADIFVIGGGEIYAQVMEDVERLHITHVMARPAGDTRFPPIDPTLWRVVSEERVPAGPRDSHETRYVVYHRAG